MATKETKAPSVSLVQLNAEYQSIAHKLIAAGGELTPENEAEFEEVLSLLVSKTDAYGIVSDRLKAEAEFWGAQKDHCAQAQRVCENALKSLKERMRFVLGQMPEEALQGQFYRFFLSPSKDTLEIDEVTLPDFWKKTKIDVVPDRARIEAALATGLEVQGVTVKTGNKSLRQGRPK